MEVGSPEWIENSLAQLDALEQQRGALESGAAAISDPAALRQHTLEIERLSGEIKALYAQLEAVADDDDDDEAAEEGDGSPSATQGDDELSAPHFSAMVDDGTEGGFQRGAGFPATSSPSSPAASDNPFSSPAASPAGAAGFDAPAQVSFDDDLKPHGGGSKWVFLLVVVLIGGGVGGYFAWQNMQAQKANEATGPSEPEKVIKAAEVPDDTEEPNAAVGGEASISPNANSDAGDTNGGASSKKKKEEKKTKPIVLKGGDGPL